jgi:hypothetical protein
LGFLNFVKTNTLFKPSTKSLSLIAALCWAPVAHICNPSYSGGSNQENRGLKPVWANSLQKSRTPGHTRTQKRTGGVAQGVDPEFKTQYRKEKKSSFMPYAPEP